jgi:hypothetical protein
VAASLHEIPLIVCPSVGEWQFMNSPKICAVINTLNEEANITDCIKSLGVVGEYVDEILVCDNDSTDRTRDLARQAGARVITFPRAAFVTVSRHYAYSQCDADWVFALDADERATPALLAALRKCACSGEARVYRFAKLQYFLGDFVRHGGWFMEHFRQFFERKMYLDHYRSDREGPHDDFASLEGISPCGVIPKESGAYLLHYAYHSVDAFLRRALGYYCRISAEREFAQSGCGSAHALWLRGTKQFIRQYGIQGGWRDGRRGLVLALMMAGYFTNIEIRKWVMSQSQLGVDFQVKNTGGGDAKSR